MSARITVIPGDGIGPEIVKATLRCLDALCCDFDYRVQTGGHGDTMSFADAIIDHL